MITTLKNLDKFIECVFQRVSSSRESTWPLTRWIYNLDGTKWSGEIYLLNISLDYWILRNIEGEYSFGDRKHQAMKERERSGLAQKSWCRIHFSKPTFDRWIDGLWKHRDSFALRSVFFQCERKSINLPIWLDRFNMVQEKDLFPASNFLVGQQQVVWDCLSMWQEYRGWLLADEPYRKSPFPGQSKEIYGSVSRTSSGEEPPLFRPTHARGNADFGTRLINIARWKNEKWWKQFNCDLKFPWIEAYFFYFAEKIVAQDNPRDRFSRSGGIALPG